jgi:hypothetical protein
MKIFNKISQQLDMVTAIVVLLALGVCTALEYLLSIFMEIKNTSWYVVLSILLLLGVATCTFALYQWSKQRKYFDKMRDKFNGLMTIDKIQLISSMSFEGAAQNLQTILDASIVQNRLSTDIFKGYYDAVFKNLYASRSISSANSIARHLAETRQSTFDIFMIMPRYIAWLIPSIGFIGTIVGISIGFDVLSESFANTDIKSMGGFFDEFSVAFETTLVALIFTALLYFAISWIESRAYKTLYLFLEFIEEDVLIRLPNPETADIKLLLTSVTHSIETAGKKLTIASESLETAAKSLINHEPTKLQQSTIDKIDSVLHELGGINNYTEQIHNEMLANEEHRKKDIQNLNGKISELGNELESNKSLLNNAQKELSNMKNDILDAVVILSDAKSTEVRQSIEKIKRKGE